jgi:hypothetical protein
MKKLMIIVSLGLILLGTSCKKRTYCINCINTENNNYKSRCGTAEEVKVVKDQVDYYNRLGEKWVCTQQVED